MGNSSPWPHATSWAAMKINEIMYRQNFVLLEKKGATKE